MDFKYSFILTFSHYKETAFICSAFPIIRRNSLYQDPAGILNYLFSKFLGMSDMFPDLASKFHLHHLNG